MTFQSFVRQRARQVTDPMNPDRTISTWENPVEIDVVGFLDSASSTEVQGASRAEVVTSADLHLPDALVDVKRGDRITDGDRTWVVEGFPPAPVNPFTGWQPYKVARLKEVVG